MFGYFVYILLAIWVFVMPTIIILSRKDLENNIRLLIIQIYNFIIGLSVAIIHYLIVFGVLMIFDDSGWDLIIDNLFWKAYTICMIIIFTILLVPMNKYMMKKINMNVISYILLSIMSIGLGLGVCVLMDRICFIL